MLHLLCNNGIILKYQYSKTLNKTEISGFVLSNTLVLGIIVFEELKGALL